MTDYKPGPGWTQSKDGHWYSHFFTYDDFPGTRAVAVVFKSVAAVVLVSGVLAAALSLSRLHGENASSNEQLSVVFGIVGGTIIAASAMAFFGYVLQLLVTIHF